MSVKGYKMHILIAKIFLIFLLSSRRKSVNRNMTKCHPVELIGYQKQLLPLGTLSKPRRWRRRGHTKTKDLIGRKIAQHVRFKTFHISQPSYAKQQRKINTICAVCEPKPRRQIIFNFHLEFNASFIRYAQVEVWRRMRRSTHAVIF